MLMEAKSICLVTDLWSNSSNQHFLALAASMNFNDFTKKIRVIGMEPTNGSSNAEAIKDLIEKIINRFKFDKRKICGVTCDQVSALLRLFKQNDNYLFDQNINSYSGQIFNFDNESNGNEVKYLFNQIDREIDQIADDPPPRTLRIRRKTIPKTN